MTNLPLGPEAVYAVYRQRGDVENRHKELKDSLGLGRTSCPRFLANQVRVLLTATAYILFQTLQQRVQGTACAGAQVATLRERTTGTLERLMASPIGKGDVIAGYALAFALLAVVQAVVLTSFTVGVLGMNSRGSLGLIMLVAVLDAILGSTLGLAASALARTEFQAVQLMPVFLFPQLITCGLLIPRAAMPSVLEAISRALPLTYGIDALQRLEVGATFADVRGDVLVIVGFIALAIVVGSTTLRRRTP